MRRNAIIRIMIYSIVIFLLLALLLGGIVFSRYAVLVDSGVETLITGSGSAPVTEVQKLDIDWASGEIYIQEASCDGILFHESGSEDHEMVYSLENGTLSIYYEKPRSAIGFYNGSYPEKILTIIVPKGLVCQELSIDSASTDAYLENLTVQAVDLDSASNEFHFTDCQIGTLDIDGASNIIHLTGTLEELDCDGMSCELKLELRNTPRSIDLDGMSTTLDLRLPADTGFEVTMDGLSNEFTSDFEVTHTENGPAYGDRRLTVEVDGLSSSVTIRKGE